jgi:outer membrane protein assembly factor BamD
MKHRLHVALMATLVSAAGCSSVSLPTIPWFSSSATVDPTAEALFEEGTRAFNEKKYVRALDNFSKIRTDHPFTPLMTQVELKIADAYYLNQQYPEAVNALKEFQSMHPTNENIPFVLLRLGQAHFDQFTATDRDQKNTEIAKAYFENVMTNYSKSPQAVEASEKLAKTLEYLAEHEFNIAQFYMQEAKYLAAQDRFEEIIRKYKSTPTAVKSLFYLGESYRLEKNPARAALAYEALLQHYPQSKFAAEARTQLAIVEKEKRDPLELVLRRDRRPGSGAAPEIKEDPALAKLKDLNLVAKKEVVQEEPGDEKGFFRRVADKINPFASSDSDKKSDAGKREETKPESGMDILTKRQQAQKQESSGFFASLWPFGSKEAKQSTQSSASNASAVVTQVDESLKQKGIDDAARQTASKPPVANLPKEEAKPAPVIDTAALLSSIDDNLQKTGKSPTDLPPPPEAAAAFREYAANQAAIAKTAAQSNSPQNLQTNSVLSSIDQKLKAQGLEPAKFDRPPTEEELKAAAAQRPQVKNVELEPKLALEKGPLFLNPNEIGPQEKPGSSASATNDVKKPESKPEAGESVREAPNRVLVKGPVQTQTTAGIAKPAETKTSSVSQSEENRGVFDQIRQDMENVGKVLNPFRW